MQSYDRICPSEEIPKDTYSWSYIYDLYFAHGSLLSSKQAE